MCEHKKIVIWADIQKDGRGRKKRDWVSPEGGLWFTLSFCPSGFPREYLPYIVKIPALSLVRTLKNHNIHSQVKPPNDIYIPLPFQRGGREGFWNGKKIAGILIDTKIRRESVETIYIGIGLNVNNSVKDMPDEISEIVTTMYDLTLRTYHLRDLLFEILDNIFIGFSELFDKKEGIDKLWDQVVMK